MPEPTFIPLLPAPTPQRIAPTDVAQYIRLDQCRRYLRLRLHERTHSSRFLTTYGVAPQAIPPILTAAGASFEQRVETQARAHFAAAINCRERALLKDDEFIGPDHNQVLIDRARSLAPGEHLLLLQPRLRVTLGAWELRGDADMLLLERDADGEVHVLIADIKSSTAARVEHRLQVAFYHEMLAELLRTHWRPAASIATGILYRGPASADPNLDSLEQARLDQQRAAALDVFGVADAYYEPVPDPAAYLAEVRGLVTNEDSTAARVAAADFADLPFHLAQKCDGCLYNEFCMKWAAEHDDLSLIPYLSAVEKNALQAQGITRNTQLAALKTFPSDESTELTPVSGQEDLLRRLSGLRGIGSRLDELIHRARRLRRWKGDDLRALTYIPSKGYGTLPACDATIHPNLVRIYLDVQHDYQHERIYLLGARVVAAEHGEKVRHESIVRISAGPPEQPEQERDLLKDWVAAVIRAVVELAAPDAEGARRAPIHLIFFSRLSQSILLDGLARHFSSVVGAAPLYDFLTQIAGFDSPTTTIIEEERRELKNDPLVCPSLQALAGGRGFKWGEYREIFKERLFDYTGRLDEGDGSGEWYTRRARFGSQIPLEYAYAAWDRLPLPDGNDLFAKFRHASGAQLLGFAAMRLEAVEFLADDLPLNRQTEKTPFDLPDLANFSGAAPNLAVALHEFLTLERHTALSNWKHARLMPPERRVLAGVSLTLRYVAADQPPEIAARNAENERRRLLVDAWRAAYQAANPGKQFRRNKAQMAESSWSQEHMELRLRIDLTGIDCDLATALNLSSFSAGEQVVLAPRYSFDERLPPDERTPFQTTARQLLYGQRVTLRRIEREGEQGFAIVGLQDPRFGGDGRYVFGGGARPLLDGEAYTIESDPNDWYGKRCLEIVEGLQLGNFNALYERLTEHLTEANWPAAAVEAQQRFARGLDALRAAGHLHAFDANQRDFIAHFGNAATLLVQGPPGTGKSYSTAFALLARLQGALAAGMSFRVLLSCKTHAATEVLLEKIGTVQAELRRLRAVAPELFDRFFDQRILTAPRYRVHPKDPEPGTTPHWPADLHVLMRDDDARAELEARNVYFAAITPAAVARVCKGKDKTAFGRNFCDCLVLDEASQMNLAEAAMAALPLRSGGQLIVVGDHRQMPPIVQHGWADERRRTFAVFRAYASLFETLMRHTPAPPMVRFAESFRLHRDIARFLRDEIYIHDNIDYFSRRETLLAAAEHADPFVAAVLAPEHPLVVVLHHETSSQVLNQFELELISPLLQALAGTLKLNASDGLGIVVPHRAQRAAFKAMLPDLVGALLEGEVDESAVDTVERFQGGERTAILVSATESDADYLRSAGEFLLDPRRLNVALSRAKQKLILVASRSLFELFNADEEAFAHSQLWKNLLRRVCTSQVWVGEHNGIRVEVWGSRDAM